MLHPNSLELEKLRSLKVHEFMKHKTITNPTYMTSHSLTLLHWHWDLKEDSVSVALICHNADDLAAILMQSSPAISTASNFQSESISKRIKLEREACASSKQSFRLLSAVWVWC